MAGMQPHDVFRLTSTTDPRLSPDGASVAYVVASVDEESGEPRSSIWSVPVDGSTEPRRLAIHSAKGEFLVATNLPRSRLLQTAASIPVKGLPQPVAWRVRQWSGGVVEQGVARAKFALEGPAFLPTGYLRVAVQTATSGKSTGVTFVYRRPAAELDGVGLVVYQASGQDLAPPNSPDDLTVMVGHSVARWSPEDHLLEWMDGRIYRSITGPSFGLATIVRVASSLRGDAQ